MKITHATKCIQQLCIQHQKGIFYMAKHQFGQCLRGSKVGHGYVSDNRLQDDIDRFKKKPIIFIFHLRIYFVAF